MAGISDPASEIYELIKRISKTSDQTGDQHLASMFGVPVWSREFYEIIFSVLDRTKLVRDLLPEVGMDDGQKADFENHLKAIESIFSSAGLKARWNHAGGGLTIIGQGHHSALLGISSAARKHLPCPKLEPDEIADTLEQVDSLISWLKDIQKSDADFIRSALIDGLTTFRSRLAHVGWMGWGYTLAGLREVIAAYMALERQYPESAALPRIDGTKMKVKALLWTIWEKLGSANEAVDRIDIPVRLYAIGKLTQDTGIAGYLTG